MLHTLLLLFLEPKSRKHVVLSLPFEVMNQRRVQSVVKEYPRERECVCGLLMYVSSFIPCAHEDVVHFRRT
jgi:hypothetical protein